MNKIINLIKPIVSILTLLILTIHVYAQPSKNFIQTIDDKQIETNNLETHILKAMDSLKIPAVSIAVINDNKMVYHNSFGVENMETKIPVDNYSIFEGASLSKPMFAYFVMKMIEKGVIDLDKPLYKYLEHPGIAEESRDDYKLITARMVLAHQSGFPNHSKGEEISLAFTPGTGFKYSGEAYQYLLAAIGTQLGVGWEEEFNAIFEKEIMLPLNINSTSYLWNETIEKHKVFGHNPQGPTDNGKGTWNGKNFISYASIHSKADEYAKFIIAMLEQQGLCKQSFEEMLKEQVHFKEDNPLRQEVGQTGWGLGFTQKKSDLGTMHLHTGNNHDFQAYCMFLPEKKYGIVIFTNCDKMPQFLTALSKILGPQF